MSTVRPFMPQAGYTAIHNYVLDTIMPQISPNAWKVLCFILRKTLGWEDQNSPTGRKESDRLSYSQIRAGTGIASDQTVSKALEILIARRYILVESHGPWDANEYRLNQELEIETEDSTLETVVESYATTEIVAASTTEPVADATTEIVAASTTEIVDTKETLQRNSLKERERKKTNGACAPSSPLSPSASISNISGTTRRNGGAKARQKAAPAQSPARTTRIKAVYQTTVEDLGLFPHMRDAPAALRELEEMGASDEEIQAAIVRQIGDWCPTRNPAASGYYFHLTRVPSAVRSLRAAHNGNGTRRLGPARPWEEQPPVEGGEILW